MLAPVAGRLGPPPIQREGLQSRRAARGHAQCGNLLCMILTIASLKKKQLCCGAMLLGKWLENRAPRAAGARARRLMRHCQCPPKPVLCNSAQGSWL